jgi:hypothetical protein
MLDAPEYLLSLTALALVAGSLTIGAMRLRGRLLPGWSGAPARLGEALLAIALLILVAQLLGSVGLLERWPLVAACLALAAALTRALPSRASEGLPPPSPPAGLGGRVALALAAVVLAHWSIGTIAAYDTGMTGYDSAWYHMPFAAHFAQTGSTLDFASVSPRYLSWFYPQNSELLHGVGMLLTQRDVLSPALNLLWLSGCLGAAWCIGRPYGLGAWTMATAAVVLDSGLMADQAGEARNDTLALFFLLAAVALLVNGAAGGSRRYAPGPLALAGLATGLAAGTKLSFLAPAPVLAAGIALLAVRGRRMRDVLIFGAPLLAGCGFWYLRNLASAGNPLPWLKTVGPLELSGPDQGLGGRHQATVLHYLGDEKVWNRWFERGLVERLGELWPLVLGVVVIAIAAALLRARPPLRLVAAAATAAALAYLVDGTSAEGPPGHPVGFASSLRHLLPAICLGLVLLPLLPRLTAGRLRLATATLVGLLLIAADRSAEPWPPGYLVAALGLAGLALGGPAIARLDLRRIAVRPAVLAGSAIAVGAVMAGGWFAQRAYLSDRYEEAAFRSPGLNAAFAWSSRQHDALIATTLPLQYPLLGEDLTNRVQQLGLPRGDAGFVKASSCAHWLRAVNRGGFDYLVVGDRAGRADRDRNAQLAQTNASLVFERNSVEVFRLHGRLGPRACRRIHAEPPEQQSLPRPGAKQS